MIILLESVQMNSVDWKDIAHYGSALVCLAMAGLSELGVTLPGVTVDPKVAGAAGIGILAAGLKSGVTSGKAVIGFLAGALALASVGDARAADVNKPAPVFVKAPYAQSNCTQTNCSGGFLGFTIANEGGNLDILGTGLSGVANQTALGVHGGYEFWNGQWYARAKAFANYDISVQSSGAAISDKFAWGGCASLGYSLASAFGIGATGVQQPVVPSALAQSLMTPYINVCGKKQHGQQASGAGAGFEALLATNWTANVDYIHWQYGGGAAADGTVVPSRTSENEVTAGISYHFGAH